MSGDDTRFRWPILVGLAIGVLACVVIAKTVDRGTVSSRRGGAMVAARPCVSATEMHRRHSVAPRVLTVAEPQVPEVGLRLEPPPPNVQPALSAEEAYIRAVGNFDAADPGPSPTISLGLFSNDRGMMSGNPDGTVTKLVDNRLTWLIVLDGVVIHPFGPGPMPGQPEPLQPRCPLGKTILPVDAMTGALEFSMDVGRPGA